MKKYNLKKSKKEKLNKVWDEKIRKIIQTEDFVAFDFCSLVFAVILCFGSVTRSCKILNILYFEKFCSVCLFFDIRDFVSRPWRTKWDF